MPNSKRRGGFRRRPLGVAMMARSRDDAASEIETASIDGDRNMSTSFAREGSGDSARREDSGGFDRRRPDRDPSPFLPMRGAGRGGFSRRSGTSSPLPAAAGGGARGGEHEERSRLWKKADFPTDDALRKCRVHRHEDLPRHIYLLLDILGLQFRWVLTRFGRGRALVSAAAQLVDDQKEHAWMTLYAHDRDVLETLLYRRLQTLWHDCTDALAVFAKHRADTELCGQKVWEALLTAFPLDHKRMQTVLLATEFGNLMAWDGRTKADVDRHFSNITDTLEMLTFLGDNIDIEAVFKAIVLATLKSSQTKALTKAYSVIVTSSAAQLPRIVAPPVAPPPVAPPKTRLTATRAPSPSRVLLMPTMSLPSWSTSSPTAVSRLHKFSRTPTLTPTTCAAGTPYALCSRKPTITYLPRSTPTPMATAPTVAPTLKRPLHLPLIKFRYFLYMFIVGSVQGLFIFDFSSSLRFLEFSYVEGSSLTTSFRYQTFLFCNQQAFTRLVIRRAVEIETLLQLNLWDLGLVWF